MAKGFPLLSPKDQFIVRPTSVLLKRKIFDAHQNLSGKTFVDGCAGTGAMGLEALSRGADEVIFVEQSKKVFPVLQKNIANITASYGGDFQQRKIEAHLRDCKTWPLQFQKVYSRWSDEKKKNTILFLDPPYERIGLYLEVMMQILMKHWFSGQLWIESHEKMGLPLRSWRPLKSLKGGVSVSKIYNQGHSYIVVLCV